LQNTPVLPRDKDETIEVEKNGGWEAWYEVGGFSDSGPDDLHFTCDSVSGEVRFGPCLRQPNGGEQQFGTIPPKGKRIRFSRYRCGGGVQGNVGERTLTVLKSSIPYITWVTNFEAAIGGAESESLDHAKLRAPETLKARFRAVTAEDFEYLAYEASHEVARAKCLVPKGADENGTVSPGTVRLLIVPLITAEDGMIPREQLLLSDQLRREVTNHLDERRLLNTRLVVTEPDYIWVTVEAKIKAKIESKRLRGDIERKLYQFINPISGGIENTGWPFGRNLLMSEIHSVIQGMPEVGYVEEIKLFPINIETGERREAATILTLSPGQLPCSYQHKVEVT
jgi:predicted phage baseplate assembly protein